MLWPICVATQTGLTICNSSTSPQPAYAVFGSQPGTSHLHAYVVHHRQPKLRNPTSNVQCRFKEALLVTTPKHPNVGANVTISQPFTTLFTRQLTSDRKLFDSPISACTTSKSGKMSPTPLVTLATIFSLHYPGSPYYKAMSSLVSNLTPDITIINCRRDFEKPVHIVLVSPHLPVRKGLFAPLISIFRLNAAAVA